MIDDTVTFSKPHPPSLNGVKGHIITQILNEFIYLECFLESTTQQVLPLNEDLTTKVGVYFPYNPSKNSK